eukprot:TRINITY_DN3821_c0_g2_i1.p1 TRINITY_DN3821_c0_g2~~TRINITY_DN3821_c0_g2_i1.p1  ORF type:complete len:838 (+),score=232.47 TRINITY_DN3821_c0_g2_i1:70-2583(+)
MSAGFDIGNKFMSIGVAQRGGVDIITNEVSKRQTSALVGFSDKRRFIGESARTQHTRNLKNTISQVKRLIGRTWDEKELQEELPFLPFTVKELNEGAIGIEVTYKGLKTTFSPEEIMGMLLRHLKNITEKAIKVPLREVVISVPGFFTSAQRKAFLDATDIAGVNCTRLLNEITATALTYGIYKTDLPAKDAEPLKVLFVDMGDSNLGASVVEFNKGRLKVKSSAYDRTLGGRNFDLILAEHLAAEFNAKYGLDVMKNPKARFRLLDASEKFKKVLSANTEAPANVEFLMNEKDLRTKISRDTLETLAAPLLERVAAPLQSALEQSGYTKDQIDVIELVGGGTRMPAIGRIVTEVLGKWTRTLNAEECVAKGCALQAAILSPAFKVREFKIEDANLYPIEVSWKDIGAMDVDATCKPLFPRGAIMPGVKLITFPHANPFEISAAYGAEANLPPGVNSKLGTWRIPVLPEATGESPKVRVKIRLNSHGIFSVESAQMRETIPPPPEPMEEDKKDAASDSDASTPEPAATAESQKDNGQTKEENGAEKSDSNATGDAAKKTEPEKKKEPAKATIKTTDIKIESDSIGISESEIKRMANEENMREMQDREIVATAEAKNSLEEYIYSNRSALSDEYELKSFVTDDLNATITAQLEADLKWLYADGEQAAKAEYVKRKTELEKFCVPIRKRKQEFDNRGEAIEKLESTLAKWRAQAQTEEEKFSHIEQPERKKITDKCDQVEKDVLVAAKKLIDAPKTEDPTLLTADITKAASTLDSFCAPIMNKRKPAPPKEEKKDTDEKKDDTDKKASSDEQKKKGPTETKEQDTLDGDAKSNGMEVDD